MSTHIMSLTGLNENAFSGVKTSCYNAGLIEVRGSSGFEIQNQ
jgi:hypothetical protein